MTGIKKDRRRSGNSGDGKAKKKNIFEKSIAGNCRKVKKRGTEWITTELKCKRANVIWSAA
jgi:hypothetical protein